MEKRRYKIKPPEVWTQVRKDYLSGLDAKTVAARHDVTEASIRARATKEGWSRHPRSEAATPAPQPLSPQEATPPPWPAPPPRPRAAPCTPRTSPRPAPWRPWPRPIANWPTATAPAAPPA